MSTTATNCFAKLFLTHLQIVNFATKNVVLFVYVRGTLEAVDNKNERTKKLFRELHIVAIVVVVGAFLTLNSRASTRYDSNFYGHDRSTDSVAAQNNNNRSIVSFVISTE